MENKVNVQLYGGKKNAIINDVSKAFFKMNIINIGRNISFFLFRSEREHRFLTQLEIQSIMKK